MVSRNITKDSLSKSKFYPCRVYSLRVKANSFLYVKCGMQYAYSAVSRFMVDMMQ